MKIKTLIELAKCPIRITDSKGKVLCKEFNPNNPKHDNIGEMFVKTIRCEIVTGKLVDEIIARPIISVCADTFEWCHSKCYSCSHFLTCEEESMCDNADCELFPPKANSDTINLFALNNFCRSPIKVMSAYNSQVLCREFNSENPKHLSVGKREVVSVWAEIFTRSHGFTNTGYARLCVYVDGKPEYDAEHQSAAHNELNPCEHCPRNGSNDDECAQCKKSGYPCADCDYCELDEDGCCNPSCENCEYCKGDNENE